MRETLEVVARVSGRMPEEGINPGSIPAEVAHVWSWFTALRESAGAGLNGPLPITNLEMLAFFTLEGMALEGWETRAIRAVDSAYLRSLAKDEEQE